MSAGEPEVAVPAGQRDRLEQALFALAAARATASYVDLARQLAVAPPHHLRKLIVTLEQLATEHHEAGLPIYSALCVSRVREGLPAPGFFAHLSRIGAYDGSEDGESARAWHAAELERIFRAPPR